MDRGVLLMAITTLLAALSAAMGLPSDLVHPVTASFFIIDLIFFAANFHQLFEGGWFPLVLRARLAFVMPDLAEAGARLVGGPSQLAPAGRDLIETGTSGCQARLPGTAVFLHPRPMACHSR